MAYLFTLAMILVAMVFIVMHATIGIMAKAFDKLVNRMNTSNVNGEKEKEVKVEPL